MKQSSSSCRTGKVEVCVEGLERWKGEVGDLKGRAGLTLRGRRYTRSLRYDQVMNRLYRSCLELY